jgi:hypothetical protein
VGRIGSDFKLNRTEWKNKGMKWNSGSIADECNEGEGLNAMGILTRSGVRVKNDKVDP